MRCFLVSKSNECYAQGNQNTSTLRSIEKLVKNNANCAVFCSTTQLIILTRTLSSSCHTKLNHCRANWGYYRKNVNCIFFPLQTFNYTLLHIYWKSLTNSFIFRCMYLNCKLGSMIDTYQLGCLCWLFTNAHCCTSLNVNMCTRAHHCKPQNHCDLTIFRSNS